MRIFTELGLTKYETGTYKTLISYGRLPATKISELSRVPITAVYPALKQLIEKKLILKFEGDPTTFETINIKRAIEELIKEKKEKLDELGKKVIELSKKTKKEEEKEKIVEVGTGREFSEKIYHEFFDKAKESIFIMGWRMEKVGNKYNILKRLKKPLKRKVDVRLILIGDRKKKQMELINDYKKSGIKIKFLPLEDFSILLKDDDCCKITIKKRKNEKISINIIDRNLTETMRQYYLNSWERAEEI